MRVGTDDEVYRVDAIWLGPDELTMPFRARYVAWGVGLAFWLTVFSIMRAASIPADVFSVAWSVIIAVALTRLAMRLISHERPLSAVLMMLAAEARAPTQRPRGWTWHPTATHLRIRDTPGPRHAHVHAGVPVPDASQIPVSHVIPAPTERDGAAMWKGR